MPLAFTGQRVEEACRVAGRTLVLLGSAAWQARHLRRGLGQVARQIDIAGFGSLLVLALIAGLSGMILVMQTGPELAKWGTTDALGPVVAATFTREMGPVWAAIIVLARVGSAMAAELGTMVVNEEVEALRVMDIDPVRYLVLPRVIGLLITLPLLTVVANVVGLAGGALVAQSQFQVPIADFMEGAAWMLTGYDFLGSLIKGAVFGLVIGVICCDQGLACKAGAEGVGRATTTAVRLCVVFVLLTDLVVTAVLASVGRLL